ncbi:hypothetical protein [Helicobacter winghamensis]|uniref:hypothetical protein n=1 Tax=Helicobacter winghamensis TaxID=157268 RepID=UPI0027A91CF0
MIPLVIVPLLARVSFPVPLLVIPFLMFPEFIKVVSFLLSLSNPFSNVPEFANCASSPLFVSLSLIVPSLIRASSLAVSASSTSLIVPSLLKAFRIESTLIVPLKFPLLEIPPTSPCISSVPLKVEPSS